MYAHLLEPPPQVTHKRPDLSPEIDAVVAKAMAKSPDDRYATTPEFATAMRKALIGTELAADAAGRPAARARDRPDRRRGRHRRRAAGRASATGCAAGSAARGSRDARRPEAKEVAPAGRDHPAAPDRGRHRRRHPRPHRRLELEQDRGLVARRRRAQRGRERMHAAEELRRRNGRRDRRLHADGERRGGVPGQPDAVLLLERQGRVEARTTPRSRRAASRKNSGRCDRSAVEGRGRPGAIPTASSAATASASSTATATRSSPGRTRRTG